MYVNKYLLKLQFVRSHLFNLGDSRKPMLIVFSENDNNYEENNKVLSLEWFKSNMVHSLNLGYIILHYEHGANIKQFLVTSL
jgi:hypothetical protein